MKYYLQRQSLINRVTVDIEKKPEIYL